MNAKIVAGLLSIVAITISFIQWKFAPGYLVVEASVLLPSWVNLAELLCVAAATTIYFWSDVKHGKQESARPAPLKEHPFVGSIVIAGVVLVIGMNIPYFLSSRSSDSGGESFFDLKTGEALLVFFTFLLWWSTRGLVNEAKSTSRRELQAYVFISKSTVENVAVGNRPAVEITFQNFGRTPAFNLKIKVDLAIINTGAPLSENGGLMSSPGALAPGGSYTAAVSLDNPYNAAQIVGLTNGDQTMWVFGRIDYEDTFGTTRWTSFRRYIGGTMGIGSNLAASKEGNDADRAA